MPSFEVLISAMHQTDLTLAKKCNANADVLVINQCDRAGYDEEIYNGYKLRMISTTERGVSNSRNMAIKNAQGEILLLSDDDEVFRDGYKEAILSAFEAKPKADLIAFNVTHTNARNRRAPIKTFKKVPRYKSFGTWCLAFRREIYKYGIWFNPNVGPGSGNLICGEDSLWQRDLRKAGLVMYQNPFCIANVEQSESTWFHGYDQKFFYLKGAYLSAAHMKFSYIYALYYALRLFKHKELRFADKMIWVRNGIIGYGRSLTYEEFCKLQNNGKEGE